MSASAHTHTRIYLLGRFEIVRGEHTLKATDWTRRKAATLLQRLALEHRLVKDQAIDFLWPDADLASGANNLYRTLFALRQLLDDKLGSGVADTIFAFKDGLLALSDSVWVDAHEFQRLATGLHSPEANQANASLSTFQDALALYQGHLLADDLYSDWITPYRDHLRRLYRELCLALGQQYRQQQAYDRAIALLTPLLQDDLADEGVHRELMRLLALSGRRHEALRQYQVCVDALASELDVSPEPETTALYEQLLRGDLNPPPLPVSPVSAWIPAAPLAIESELTTPFVGRELELEMIRQQVHVVWQGRGRTLLLAGDTGVGKTRLAYETLQASAAAGMTVLYGAFYEQEGQLPYQPFIEAFNRYLQEQRRPLTDNPITHHKPLGSTDPQQEHWALFNATLAFLINLAGQAPVILLVDDLHAADETSLRLCHYLARQTRHTPVILLATYRTDIVIKPLSPFGTFLNALYRERLSTVVNLTSLAQHSATRIMVHALEGEPTPELAHAIFEATEGNPLFVEEMVQALLKGDYVERTADRWALKPGASLRVPSGLRELLQERIAHLGGDVVSALETAAIVGREFSFEVLRRVTVLPDSDLLTALDGALNGHLLAETATGYRFRHMFIRHVLYDAQSQPRRSRLHTLTARAIEALYGERSDGLTPYVESLAHHYLSSDSREQALPYLLRAGEKAAGLFAFEVAVDIFEQGLALMDEFGLNDPALRWQILEPLGWWGIILADTVRTVTRFEQALALPTTETWQPRRSDRVRVHRGAAVALITAGHTDAAEKHLLTALALVDEEEDAADYTLLLYNIAQLHWHRNEYRQAFDVAQRSLGIAERLNDPESIARAFEMLALACHSTGDWQQGLLFEEQRSSLVGPLLDVTAIFDVHL